MMELACLPRVRLKTAPTYPSFAALERVTMRRRCIYLHAAAGRRPPPPASYWITQFGPFFPCFVCVLLPVVWSDRECTAPAVFPLPPAFLVAFGMLSRSPGYPSPGRVCRALHRTHAAALHTARRHATVRGFLHPGWLFTGRKAADLPGMYVVCGPCPLLTNT